MENNRKVLLIAFIFSILCATFFAIASQNFPLVFGKCETCPPNMMFNYSVAAFIVSTIFGILAMIYPSISAAAKKQNFETKVLVPAAIAIVGLAYLLSLSPELYFDDSYSHFLNAKYSWEHPILFSNFWHKPLFNFIISIPAQLGITYVALLNVAISLGAVFFTYLAAKELNVQRPYLAAIICGFAPIFYLVSNSVLTEPMFALFATIAVYLLAKRDYLKSAFFISLLPFIRTEGIFAICIWLFVLWREKKLQYSPALFIVPVLITIICSLAKQDPLWLIHDNVYIGHTFYGTGPVTNFFEKFFLVSGPVTLLLVQLGLFAKFFEKKFFANNWLFLSYFLFYVFAFTVGGLAAASEVREMAAIVPMVAILGAVGLNSLIDRSVQEAAKIKRSEVLFSLLFVAEIIFLHFFIEDFTDKIYTALFALTAVLYLIFIFYKKIIPSMTRFTDFKLAAGTVMVMLIVLCGIFFVHPVRVLDNERSALQETAQWMEQNGLTGQPILSSHAYMHMAAGSDPFTNSLYYHFAFAELRLAPSGTILVWDAHYSSRYGKMQITDLPALGYVHLKSIELRGSKVDVFRKE